MSNAAFIYLAAALFGVLTGWGFAITLQEIFEMAPSENPGLSMLIFGIGTPAVVWLVLRPSFR